MGMIYDIPTCEVLLQRIAKEARSKLAHLTGIINGQEQIKSTL